MPTLLVTVRGDFARNPTIKLVNLQMPEYFYGKLTNATNICFIESACPMFQHSCKCERVPLTVASMMAEAFSVTVFIMCDLCFATSWQRAVPYPSLSSPMDSVSIDFISSDSQFLQDTVYLLQWIRTSALQTMRHIR